MFFNRAKVKEELQSSVTSIANTNKTYNTYKQIKLGEILLKQSHSKTFLEEDKKYS